MFCIAKLSAQSQTVSPFQYGYNEAKTGEDRYEVLYKTHCEAVKIGANVDYTGINKIDLTIPYNAKSIPLTSDNDFSGVTISVTNTNHSFFLFEKVYPIEPVEVTKCMIRNGVYPSIKKKTNKRVLLIIEDKTPWVAKRNGYNYGVIRKDAIVVKRGKAKNTPVYPYNSKQSKPIAYYRELAGEGTRVSNLTFNRTDSSTYITHLLNIINEDDIKIENVEINTPESSLNRDAIFRIENSTNVYFSNVHINNTYSQISSYGYGINLENVTNVKFDNFSGFGKWGVFGNNNVNTVSFRNSKMNRFDIHCYGKNVTFENCEFFDLYNQVSSFYGKLVFRNCIFTDFIPVAIEASYNAYTGFDIFFDSCVFNTTSSNHALVIAGRIDEDSCFRSELSRLCWPNIYINNMTINAGYAANPLYFYVCGGGKQIREIDNLSCLSIKGLNYNTIDKVSHIKSISLCNVNVFTANKVKIDISDVQLGSQEATKEISSPDGKFYINLKQKDGNKQDIRVLNSDIELIEQ